MLQKKVIITLAAVAILPISTRMAYAESLVISGNGEGSTSVVNVSDSQQANVSQDNNADVNNQVDIKADTGNNSISDNTGGENNIQTGDISTTTSLENNLNHSVADSTQCCEGVGNAVIANNGAGTDNAISYTSNSNVSANLNQTANITNSIFGTANTGGNNANNNNGNVNIETGSIKVNEFIKNSVNKSLVNLGVGSNQIFSLTIKNNGADSTNTINFEQNSDVDVNINNTADIFNQSIWTLITGNNEAKGNNGDVTIKTGKIDVTISIENNANHNEVIVDCGCVPTPPPPPPCTGDGCNPPSNGGNGGNGGGGNGGGGNGGGGSSSGPSSSSPSKDVLPATGMPWMIMLLLGNLLMLLFGMVLRLRSGNSPSIA